MKTLEEQYAYVLSSGDDALKAIEHALRCVDTDTVEFAIEQYEFYREAVKVWIASLRAAPELDMLDYVDKLLFVSDMCSHANEGVLLLAAKAQ